MTDGERLQLAVKELGSCDLYPQVIFPWLYFWHFLSSPLLENIEHYLSCNVVWDAELETQSKWQICCCLWRWRVHYLHCTCMEKSFIWLCTWICLVNGWWICCEGEYIQNQDLQQDLSGRITCLEPSIIIIELAIASWSMLGELVVHWVSANGRVLIYCPCRWTEPTIFLGMCILFTVVFCAGKEKHSTKYFSWRYLWWSSACCSLQWIYLFLRLGRVSCYPENWCCCQGRSFMCYIGCMSLWLSLHSITSVCTTVFEC